MPAIETFFSTFVLQDTFASIRELIKKRVTKTAVIFDKKLLLVLGVPRSVFRPPRLSLPVFCNNTADSIKKEIEHCAISKKLNIKTFSLHKIFNYTSQA